MVAVLLPAPETLHPAVWRAHQLGRGREEALPTGFAALDAELPGGGWPRRALSELLLPHEGIGELRLLAPTLRQVARAGRMVMLFDPPSPLCAPGWAQLGLPVERLLLVLPRQLLRGAARERLPPADVLWALEQALKSGHVGAVLAWLPVRLRTKPLSSGRCEDSCLPPRGAVTVRRDWDLNCVLRRLQLAAQAHDGPAFVLRETAAQQRPSPAPLRLVLQPAGADALSVRLLKRRGPALPQALRLQLPPVLPALARTPAEPSAGEAAVVPAVPQAPQPSAMLR